VYGAYNKKKIKKKKKKKKKARDLELPFISAHPKKILHPLALRF
jgi:hypothetical protein